MVGARASQMCRAWQMCTDGSEGCEEQGDASVGVGHIHVARHVQHDADDKGDAEEAKVLRVCRGRRGVKMLIRPKF
jgi:hypothetical protein